MPRSQSTRTSAAPPYRSIVSQMSTEHHRAVEAAAAAELRGDWATALAEHRAVPIFARSQHGAHLRLMSSLGDAAPGWLVGRFLTVLGHRLEMYGQPRRAGRVLQRVAPLLYPWGVPLDTLGIAHPEQIAPQLFGLDWVVRQMDLYDLGGLADLINTSETLGVLARANLVDQWCGSLMGGYRVLAGAAGESVVVDAATREEVALLDLGLTISVTPGTWVLGRVVPTAAGPGWLFDTRPLEIDRDTARAVAQEPGRWLSVLSARLAAGLIPEGFSHARQTSLSADLPAHSWVGLLGHPIGPEPPRPPATMAAEALRAALRLATDPARLDTTSIHLVSELLLDEVVDERLVTRFATPAHQASWRVLRGVLPAHSARRCEQALWWCEAAGGEGGPA